MNLPKAATVHRVRKLKKAEVGRGSQRTAILLNFFKRHPVNHDGQRFRAAKSESGGCPVASASTSTSTGEMREGDEGGKESGGRLFG